MAEATMYGEQIGSVISMTGSAWAISGNSQRPLEQGAPVYQGEEIVTESDSNVEIKLADDTILGQGEDSAIRLDEYVYSESDNLLDFHMVKGVLRVVSGEIVKANPEGFNLSTPMATIGIRGTEVMVQIDQGREIIGVDKIGEGHQVIVSNAFNQVIIDKPGMFSGVDFDGSLIVPDEMPENFISAVIQAAPLTLLGDPPRSPGDPQNVVPPQIYETISNWTGESQPAFGMEARDQEDEEDEDIDEDFELSEAEIETMLAMETAAGTEAEGEGEGEELGGLIETEYAPFTNEMDSNTGDPATTGTTGDSGDGTPPSDDPPPDDLPPADPPPADPPPADPPPADPPPAEPPPAPDPPSTENPPATAPPQAQDASTDQPTEDENSTVTYNVITEGNTSGDNVILTDAYLPQDSDYSGTVSHTTTGTITYTPAPGEEGTVNIEYEITDDSGSTDTGELSVTLAEDSTPIFTNLTDLAGDESGSLAELSGTLAVNYGADDANTSIKLASPNAVWNSSTKTLTGPANAWTVTLTGNQYSFTQNTAFSHTGDTLVIPITVTATDADNSQTNGSFTVTITDDVPTAAHSTAFQDTIGATVSYNVFEQNAATVGADGATLSTASLTDTDYAGTLVSFADGTIEYTPKAGENGVVPISYTVTDGDGDSATATLYIELLETPGSSDVVVTTDGQGGEIYTGTEGDDSIDGGTGQDTIFGTGGNDDLLGDNSDDIIFGGAGNDLLVGDRGNDELTGGEGIDTLSGGKGNDTFVFTSPQDGHDIIVDFRSVNDQIALYENAFDLNHEQGILASNQFVNISSATFSGGVDFDGATSGLVYASEEESTSGKLYYDPNDTVPGNEILLATVTEEGRDDDIEAEDIVIT